MLRVNITQICEICTCTYICGQNTLTELDPKSIKNGSLETAVREGQGQCRQEKKYQICS